MMKKYLAIFLVAALAFLPVSCEEPEEEIVPEIKVPAASEAVFASGIKFEAGEEPGQPAAGQTMQLQFTATDRWTAEVMETKASTWLSVEPSSGVAGDVTMTVTAKPNPLTEPRKATVTIKCGDKSKSLDVVQEAAKPTLVEVASIMLDKTELAMVVGDEITLTATVKPDDATDKTVTWATSDDKVATVQDGKVTAIAEGTATITAAAGAQSATCEVTVSKKIIHVTSIELDRTSLRLAIGESELLVARILPDDATDKSYTWASTNSSIAEVDAAGKVTAKSEGTVTITATTTDGGLMAGCEVTVYNPVIVVTSVTLDKSEIALVEGESFKLTATVKPDDATDKTVTWATSDATVATVDSDGHVTAIKEGAATITASAGAQRATCLVTVAKKIIPVESVTLDRKELNLIKGATATLTATVAPADATSPEVKWASSDESVATVDKGVVTAKKSGRATITATAENASATCTVTVTNPATGISLDRASAALTEGESITLKATVTPADADDKTVSWASSNANVATVDANGKVTAKAEGTATITATCGAFSATCSITVAKLVVPVASVTLDKARLELTEGESGTLTATVNPSNATDKTVSWSTSDANIATVDNSGRVTAVKEGSATITAKAGDKTATCTVTVTKRYIAVESITLSKTQIALTKGQTEILTATVKPDDATDKAVTWSSSDSKVATVDNGVVTALKSGTATITAKAGDKTATCAVTVTTPVTGITLDKAGVALTEGENITLKATVNPSDADDKTVSWTSSNANIATVDGNGKVTAKAEGTATITATCGAFTATCNITVAKLIIPVTSVVLNKSQITLTEGETETLTATVSPANATEKTVTWTCSNANVATVDGNGKVTAIAQGTATITATAGNASATCAVTVNKLVIPVTSVSLSKTSLALTKGQMETIIATVLPSNATDNIVTWTTSNAAVATVANGTIKAVKSGSATITATAGGKSATCEVTVTTPVTGITLSRTTATITEGDNITITATVLPSDADDKTVSWTSSNANVATVDGNGKVTAVSEGTATITATCGSFSATCAVTVNKLVIPVSSVTLNKTSLSLTKGQSETLTATVNPDNATDKTVTWSSSNSQVATVDNSGKVTAASSGSATITATAGGKSATCTVTVTNPVTGITLDKGSLELTEGDNATLTATVSPADADNRTVSWKSSNSAVATVNNSGRVTAVAAGTATITASCSGYSATCAVTVNKLVIPVSSITLDESSLTLEVGDYERLWATVNPSDATDKDVTWSSSNEQVATVDDTGKVTAVDRGTATITAKAGDKSATCTVQVIIPLISITLDNTELALTPNDTYTFVVTFNPEDADIGEVEWSSSDTSVATVVDGVVTAHQNGTATITITAGGITAECEVTVSEPSGSGTLDPIYDDPVDF